MPKSIPAAKYENFVDISGAQNPTWAKFLEFDRYYQKKNQYGLTSSSYINLTMKIVDKILTAKQNKKQNKKKTTTKQTKKNRAKIIFYVFWEVVS